MKLTKREKFLITIAAAIGLVYLIVFVLFMPALEKLQNKKDTLSMMKLSKSEMQMAISTLSISEQNLEELQKRVIASQEVYSDAADSNEIGELLTRMCLRYTLSPRTLNIDNKSTPVKVAAAGVAAAVDQSVNALSSIGVEMRLEGDFQNIKALIDEIYSTDYIRLRYMDYNTGGESVTVRLIVYVREDINITRMSAAG